MQLINHLNEKIQIFQSTIATKNAAITAVKQMDNDRSTTTTTTQPPMVIVVPSLDEIKNHRGKNAKIKRNPYNMVHEFIISY